jgi:hypothetical protein
MLDVQVTLLSPASLEEKLVDYLMVNPAIEIFTSRPVAAHGLPASSLNAIEQVTGSAKFCEVSVILSQASLDGLLGELAREFGQSGLRYWASHITDFGALV